jgi:hypothetical protein
MALSNFLQPPKSSRLRSLVLRRSLELGLLIAGTALSWVYGSFLYELDEPTWSILTFLEPLELVILLAAGPACLLAAWWLRSRGGTRAADAGVAPGLPTDHAVALEALPSTFPLAMLSRLPLVARLLQARLEFGRNALAFRWRGGESRIAHSEIARADWQPNGVLLLFRDGRQLLIPTGRPPRFSGPSGHYPELRQALQAATFATLRHNQDVADRIQSECDRDHGVSYRRAPRALD